MDYSLGSDIVYLIKFAVSTARKTFQNLQANFYAPFSMKISLSTHALLSLFKFLTKYSLGVELRDIFFNLCRYVLLFADWKQANFISVLLLIYNLLFYLFGVII